MALTVAALVAGVVCTAGGFGRRYGVVFSCRNAAARLSDKSAASYRYLNHLQSKMPADIASGRYDRAARRYYRWRMFWQCLYLRGAAARRLSRCELLSKAPRPNRLAYFRITLMLAHFVRIIICRYCRKFRYQNIGDASSCKYAAARRHIQMQTYAWELLSMMKQVMERHKQTADAAMLYI